MKNLTKGRAMALPEDQEGRLRCYRNALANGHISGYVRCKERVLEWLRNELAGYTEREIACLLRDHVEAGGGIDEQVETRPGYTAFGYHYDLRLRIGGRRIYFETILLCDDPDDPNDPFIEVVSVHDA